jgi:hypothetical protein
MFNILYFIFYALLYIIIIINNFINVIGIKIKNQKDVGTNYKTKEKIIFNGVKVYQL